MASLEMPRTISDLLSTLSVLYCLFLFAAYTVSVLSGLILSLDIQCKYHYDTETVAEAILIFLLVGSILFLLYFLVYLTRPSRSSLNPMGHSSAFVRFGSVLFGLGVICYLGVQIIEDIVNNVKYAKLVPNRAKRAAVSTGSNCFGVDASACYNHVDGAVRILMAIMAVLQMVAVIICSRVKLARGWGGAHFGCMHLLATNMVIWVWAVYEESKHLMHVADGCKTTTSNATANASTTELKLNQEHHITKRAAEGNPCRKFSSRASEFFFPFIIEYVLIGVTVFLNTWRAIGDPELKDKKSRTSPHPLSYLAGLDFSRTRWGAIWGFPIILLSAAVSAGLRIAQANEDCEVREIVKKVRSSHKKRFHNKFSLLQVQYSLLDVSGLIAAAIGLWRIYKLPEKRHAHSHTLDIILLRFGIFFTFLFYIFTSALDVFPNPDVPSHGEHLINGIIAISYCTLHVLFIEVLLHKTVEDENKDHPGRQVCNGF